MWLWMSNFFRTLEEKEEFKLRLRVVKHFMIGANSLEEDKIRVLKILSIQTTRFVLYLLPEMNASRDTHISIQNDVEITLGLRSPPIPGYDRDIVGHFINCTRGQWRLKLVVLDVGHVEVLLLLVVFLNHAIQGRFSDDGILVFKAD